ncbi:Oidioi.mRNA.OKI2018_I69.chr2.g6278.t1.cds [Oikopleura dioica]|uniref:Oidioi.mRNA.OKI2018_I69.chr2.g6278.t1.cds n=1 Tax=Oikopleura dioica TaxID=34765 RepID=A0ABN7T4R8_OIKDI|nr:Oidioi.mRNA.OKI2018_I69.chr2.g6278.t1.cds [Oikopleura dioica]
MRLRESLLLGIALANEWSSKWDPWNCPSSCKEQLTNYAYKCDSNTPIMEDYITESCSIHDYNSPTTGADETGSSCYFCPCKKMPFVQCSRNLNNLIATTEGQQCFANVGDGVCSCTKSMENDSDIESKCISGVSCFYDVLKMDNRAGYTCNAVTSDLDLVQSKVNFATACSQNLIHHIEGFNVDPNYYRPTADDPFPERNAATIAGAGRHLTHHIDYHRERILINNLGDGVNDLPDPSEAQEFWYGIVRSSGVTDNILNNTDNTLQNLRGKISSAYTSLQRLRKIREEKCPDRVCQCETVSNWDSVNKECVDVYCEDGSVWDPQAEECYECPEYWDPLYNECKDCKDIYGSESNWDPVAELCVYCPLNHELNYETGECEPCEEGWNSETRRCLEDCPDKEIQQECNSQCRVEYNRCKLLCETEYCASICTREYNDCLDNCPCGENCIDGCADCNNPVCDKISNAEN